MTKTWMKGRGGQMQTTIIDKPNIVRRAITDDVSTWVKYNGL